VTWRAAFQRHGRSSWSWLILVRPETMRSSTSVRYSCGSIQLSFADYAARRTMPRWLVFPKIHRDRHVIGSA
jgi:hypothetical protein